MNNIQYIRIKEDMRTGKSKTINCCLAASPQSFLSLRDQSADWSWQSPNNSGLFVSAFVRFTYNPEYPGDCHVAALLAMTAFFSATNTNLPA